MISTFDVRDSGRKSDEILNSLNGLHDRKLNGTLVYTEFSDNIINVTDLIANNIKLGKMSEEEIEDVEILLTHLVSENSDKYYSFPHGDLKRAGKTALESIDFAKDEMEKRNQFAQPVMDADSYAKTFRKLG